jgi:cell division protein FtsA
MGRESILVGLEIGTSKICAAVGEARPDGIIRILGVGQAASCGVRKGEIVDLEAAKTCVKEALIDAEQKSDVEIQSVILGVTGGHIKSFNNRGTIVVPEDRDEIWEEDIEEVRANANEVTLPQDHFFLHTITQHYYVDGQDGVLDPLGRHGRLLEADFHIIHGLGSRVKNSIRCVKELMLDVEEVVLNGIASALVVLDSAQKQQGAVVIDIGGGTTDYVVYVDGVVKQSGVLAVGGDHVTNDIVLALKLPLAKAEKLKIEEAALRIGTCLPGEVIELAEEPRFAGRTVDRETLNTIAYMRMREIFELLKERMDADGLLDYVGAGVHLTGGCSMFKGLDALAEEVFGVPAHVSHAQTMAGVTSAFLNPQFSTAIGLVKYAQMRQMEEPAAAGIGGLMNKLSGVFRRFRSPFGGRRSRTYEEEVE